MLLYSILPSSNLPSSPRLYNFTNIHFLLKFFIILPHNMTKPSQGIFSLISLHHTSLHLHNVQCHTFHTRFHCPHPSILSHHIFSDHSFPQHAFLTAVPYSMSKFLIHMSVLAGEYWSLNLNFYTSMDTFLPLIMLASDPMTHVPFTALSPISPYIFPCYQILKLLHLFHLVSFQNYLTPPFCLHIYSIKCI